jgi:major membrane immunogen (membrane-anchored lipoprotein)
MQFRKVVTAVTALFLLSIGAMAQSSSDKQGSSGDPVSGSYKGIAKSQELGDIPITVDIKNTNGKLSGKIGIPQGDATITDGTYADGKVTLKFDAGGNEGTVTAQLKGGKIVGDWAVAGQTGTLELTKSEMAAATPAAPATPPASASKPAAAGDPISGEWDASADAQGTEVPFTLKLAFAAGKVTGESSSAMGTAALSEGTFANDKLSFTLEIPQGKLTFTGTVKDGKITGDFDFPGMGAGKWQAKKK